MASTAPAVHPLQFLVGRWAGRGHGFYPTIPSFHFFEELTFTKDPAGRPIIAYQQKTRKAVPGPGGDQDLVPGNPMHAEAGFIRSPGWSTQNCELILSQPTGVSSIEVGTIVDGTTIQWKCESMIRSSTAKHPFVTHFERTWTVDEKNQTLSYVFSMGTENTPFQEHLKAVLHKVKDE